jgi:hypothetical protein
MTREGARWMQIDLNQLAPQLLATAFGLVLGAILTLVTTLLVNREASRNALALAHDQRLFDLRREAVRAASEASNTAEKLHVMDRSAASVRTLIELRQRILEPIMNSRVAFGLDTTGEKMESLTELFYKIFEASGDESKFRLAIANFMLVLVAHNDEIREAWRRTLERRNDSS